jgi:predicted HTH domain antitoxin
MEPLYLARHPVTLSAAQQLFHQIKQEPCCLATEAFVYDAYKVNSMGTISARVPDELEAELDAYLDDENLDRSTAVRKLLSEGLEEWRREQALDQLAAGKVTFNRAAELAGMSVWDFAQLAKEHDITWVAEDHVDDDLEAL